MNIFLLILELFPEIVASIQQIEATAPVPKAGPAKLQLLTKAVTSAYAAQSVNKAMISQSELTQIIDSISSDVVAFCNLVGIFKKSAA